MNTAFANKPQIGKGVYTLPEIARILRLPSHKVNRWVKNYWDGKLSALLNRKYSWTADGSKAVCFHTLIEIYIFFQLNQSGVTNAKIVKAHQSLSKKFDTAFPFAHKKVLQQLKTDGKHLYWEDQERHDIIVLDGSNQLKLTFIRELFQKADFENELIQRFWPLGRNKNIICDPERSFGHPVIGETNIHPETIYQLYQAEESRDFIAELYNLSTEDVKSAIEFCEAA